ncbi:retrovirus-related Pol polyprotein from transposon 412 [Trichonephila clavipes]|nr:retrovirus-related Pol polyprotein from transposon 412 [Trichonephila clavipes]
MTWKFATEKDQHMEMQTLFREDPVLRAANTVRELKRNLAWPLILPKTRVSTVLKELHGSPIGGHFGVMKALQKVREHVYWNNVRSDVEKCCRICDPCAARKGPRKRTRGRLQLYNVGAPFERTVFDILGPLPRSSDGNNNILVVMDYFTK